MNVIEIFTASPFFGICLSVFAFEIGVMLNRKLKTPVANPLFIAVALIILILTVLDIPFENFNNGGAMITMFLGPATASLAMNIYAQLEQLKKRLIPILAGALVGSVTSIGCILLLTKGSVFLYVL